MEMRVVVIDPGHGGSKTIGGSSPNNATGPAGTLEKDVTLDVALRIAKLGIKDASVVLTRTTDVNLGLEARAAVARAAKAVAFVSIHFNGHEDADAQGTETFVHEEASAASRDFAKALQQSLVRVTKLRDRGVRIARFGVINPVHHAPSTSAALVEVSFLTEANEEKRLASETYLDAIAAELCDALARWLAPPKIGVVTSAETTPGVEIVFAASAAQQGRPLPYEIKHLPAAVDPRAVELRFDGKRWPSPAGSRCVLVPHDANATVAVTATIAGHPLSAVVSPATLTIAAGADPVVDESVRIEQRGGNFFAWFGTQTPVFIGQRRRYGNPARHYGLKDLPPPHPAVRYDGHTWAARLGARGHWARVLHPILSCESELSFISVNTYDDVRFTFGVAQLGLHWHGEQLFRFLVDLGPELRKIVPWLKVEQGELWLRRDGSFEQITRKDDPKNLALREALNPDPKSLDPLELELAARLAVASHRPDIQRAQLEVTLNSAKAALDAVIKRMPGAPVLHDYVCAAVCDVFHQGRSRHSIVADLLAAHASDPEAQLKNLIELPYLPDPHRGPRLKAAIALAREAAIPLRPMLGTHVYDQGAWKELRP